VGLNHWVKINGRRPWLVLYRYDVGGTAYQGSEVLWNLPPQFTQGAPATVVFDTSDPGRSALRRG
jgi:hypothetical protein